MVTVVVSVVIWSMGTAVYTHGMFVFLSSLSRNNPISQRVLSRHDPVSTHEH